MASTITRSTVNHSGFTQVILLYSASLLSSRQRLLGRQRISTEEYRRVKTTKPGNQDVGYKHVPAVTAYYRPCCRREGLSAGLLY